VARGGWGRLGVAGWGYVVDGAWVSGDVAGGGWGSRYRKYFANLVGVSLGSC
jgi:hypothetical protein